ncbi:MAG TPA: hypothetical protein VF851_07595 [Steroidobacteraceae bacterium]
MKRSTSLLVLPLLLALGAGAHAACVYPQAPQTLPNGSKSTKEEMLAAKAQVKEYSKSVQEVYLPCLESEKNESIAALDNMDPEYTQKKTNIEAVHAKKHNAALDELQAVADRWSVELKAFSAAQKK